MSELIISFVLGGFIVYVLNYRHVRFLEAEIELLRGRENFRLGYKPPVKTPLFQRQKAETPQEAPPKNEPEKDLLTLQEEAMNS